MDIIAGLIAGQVRAAEILERRAAQVPCAQRIAWVLFRLHRRVMIGALDTWANLLPDPVAPQTTNGPVRQSSAPRNPAYSSSQPVLPATLEDRGRHMSPTHAAGASGPSPR